MITLYDNLGVNTLYEEQDFVKSISYKTTPEFITYKPPFPDINRKAFRYRPYQNIILIGFGGSNTSFKAMHRALYLGKKRLEIINTLDPDELYRIKTEYRREDTIIIAISKSGNTVSLLEALFYFEGYQVCVITDEDETRENSLLEIAKKRNLDFLAHPKIGGRFSARTPTGYLPASIFGLDIEGIDYGMRSMYTKCNPRAKLKDNPALHLALAIKMLEDKGYHEIYMPIYSSKLRGFGTLISQLVHETFGKDGRGMTVYTAQAPESQHHTNQRVFGGRKNVVSVFLRVENYDHDIRLLVPPDLVNNKLGNDTFSVFEGVPYSQAMAFELMGTYQSMIRQNMPCALLSIEKVDVMNVGELIAFFQLFVMYSASLRGMDPFNQPHVEESKNITKEYIRHFHKHFSDN